MILGKSWQRWGDFIRGVIIGQLVFALMLWLWPPFLVQGQPDIQVHFERVKESPVSVTFRVDITGDTKDLPAKIEFEGLSASVKSIEVVEVVESTYIESTPEWSQVDAIDKEGKATRELAQTGTTERTVKRVDKTPVAKLTPGRDALVFEPKSVTTRTYEVTLNVGKSVNPRGGYGSKGLLVLDIGGQKFFDNSHSSWWDSNWLYRNVLSFNGTSLSAPVANAPVRVVLTSTNFDFSLAKTNGEDIRFVDADDTTSLNYEIASWNATAQQAELWVNVPTLNNTAYADFMYIYYGNAAASDDEDPATLWASVGAVGVWHFAEGSGNTTADSTGNSANATLYGGYTWTSGGLTFDGNAGSYINAGNVSVLNPAPSTAFSFGGWVGPTVLGDNRSWLSKGNAGGAPAVNYGAQKIASNVVRVFCDDGGVGEHVDSVSMMSTANYSITVAIAADNATNILVNGVSWATGTLARVSNEQPLIIGSRDSGSTQNWPGFIDEVKVYNKALSADEAKLDHMNRLDSLLYYGATDPPPTMVTLPATSLSAGSGGVTSGYFNGTISSLGGAPSANVSFEYGTTTSYGSETAVQVVAATGNYTAAVPNNLSQGVVYHYRAKGVNVDGTGYGSDATFTIPLRIDAYPGFGAAVGIMPTILFLLVILGGGLLMMQGKDWREKGLGALVVILGLGLFSLLLVALEALRAGLW